MKRITGILENDDVKTDETRRTLFAIPFDALLLVLLLLLLPPPLLLLPLPLAAALDVDVVVVDDDDAAADDVDVALFDTTPVLDLSMCDSIDLIDVSKYKN